MAVGKGCYLAPDSGIPLIPLHHNYINIDRPLTIVTLLLIGGCQYRVFPNKTYSFITCKLLDKGFEKNIGPGQGYSLERAASVCVYLNKV